MKKCYQCGGPVEKIVGSVTIEGFTINELVFEKCQQCHEEYYDEKTSIFIQDVLDYIKKQKKKLLLEQQA